MPDILAILKSLWQLLVNEEQDVETFFVNAAKYAAQNINSAIVKATADCVAAAQAAFEQDGGVDRYAFAFSNIVATLEKDGVKFLEADINYAIEAVMQARNSRATAG